VLVAQGKDRRRASTRRRGRSCPPLAARPSTAPSRGSSISSTSRPRAARGVGSNGTLADGVLDLTAPSPAVSSASLRSCVATHRSTTRRTLGSTRNVDRSGPPRVQLSPALAHPTSHGRASGKPRPVIAGGRVLDRRVVGASSCPRWRAFTPGLPDQASPGEGSPVAPKPTGGPVVGDVQAPDHSTGADRDWLSARAAHVRRYPAQSPRRLASLSIALLLAC
jgi:hypothetical protein